MQDSNQAHGVQTLLFISHLCTILLLEMQLGGPYK